MPNFNNFVQGMKIGYQGVKDTLGPFLSYRKAKQQKAILGMQAELLDMQARTYQTAADDAMRAGMQQASAISFQTGQQKSSARTSMAAHGVRVGAQGSSAEVLTDYDISKEIQVNQIMRMPSRSLSDTPCCRSVSNKALAVRSAQKSITPWAAAITTMVRSAMESSDMMGSMSGGGKGGGMSGSTWQNLVLL